MASIAPNSYGAMARLGGSPNANTFQGHFLCIATARSDGFEATSGSGAFGGQRLWLSARDARQRAGAGQLTGTALDRLPDTCAESGSIDGGSWRWPASSDDPVEPGVAKRVPEGRDRSRVIR